MTQKILTLMFVMSVILLSAVITYASDIKEKTQFTPCQYKGAYKYYMDRGERFLSDEQYESAIESFERALIIQPNSQQARSKIVMARESLSGKKTISGSAGRERVIQFAVNQASETSDEHAQPAKRVIISRQGSEPEDIEAEIGLRGQRSAGALSPKAEEPLVYGASSRPQDVTRSSRIVRDELSDGAGSLQPAYTTPAVRRLPKPGYRITPVPSALEKRERDIEVDDTGRKYPRENYPSGLSYQAPDNRSSFEPDIESHGPVLKYPSALLPASREEDEAPSLYFNEPFECRLPVFQEFSDGFNYKIQEGTGNINSYIAPSVMRGEYRIAFGADSGGFLWKDANADYHNMPGNTSWRFLYGEDRHNSYDKAIYSRLKVDLDARITDNISGFGQMVIDPWTFVGKKKVYVTGSGGDGMELEYKYWSNTRSTINETYRTDRGDIVRINENKVKDDKTSSASYAGLTDWGSNTFNVPEEEIDRMYVPIRKLWVEYNDDPYKMKVFAMAGQEEALTSDDPMRLSNNKIWWEESAWLDRYDESRVFSRSENPLKKGQWVRNLSFMARDSEDTRLTFLRGASFNAEFPSGTSVKMVAATPRSLWDTYEQASSIPAAFELRSPVTDRLTLGGLYTFKGGVYKQSLEAMNNLGSIDASYRVFDNVQLIGQMAVSNMKVDEANGYNTDYTGYAGGLGLQSQGPINTTGGKGDRYEIKAMFAGMNERFSPGLSNYRLTRKEFEFAKHIYFDDINPENEASMFGDGIDVGRNAFNINAKAEFPDIPFDTRFDFRTVYNDSNDHVEDVYRLEGTYKPADKLTIKGLGFYKHLPKTKEGVDPLINAKSSYSAFTDYFSYEDVWLKNEAVEGGKDPSIGAFSAGLQYDLTDYFTAEGIFETTNDPKDYPRGLLNTEWVDEYYKDGILWDQIVPALYGQGPFGLPPYKYYNIYKARFIYYPFAPLKVTLKYTYNENKYAMAIDDNPTAQGIEFELKPCPRTTLGFLYQYTRQRDLYKQVVTNEGYNFDGHHNIFAAFDYQINQDQHLRVMYGAYVGYDYAYPEEHDDINALDTRHIVRFSYTGKFGPSDNRGDSALTDPRPNAFGPLNPAIPGAVFIAKVSGGWADYEQDSDSVPVKSNWDNYLLRLDLGLDAYDREYWEGGIRLGLFTTLEDEEKWEYEGLGTYQTDDMSLRGADLNANIGWAIANSSKYVSVTPMLHAGYRRVEFSRGQISALNNVPQLGEVSENFNITYAGIGARIDAGPVNSFNFYTSGYWAPFVYAPINNSRIGRLTCDRGDIWHTEGGVDYAISDRFDLNLGGFYDMQHLRKTQRIDDGIISHEMPDNKLETFGITLGGQYRF